MVRSRNKKKGFTLVEVVVSISILAIIVSPILSMVLTSVKINKSSENKQKALYIAQQTVEKQKSESTVTAGITTTQAMGFEIKKTITELNDYRFPDTSNDIEDSVATTSRKTFSDIKYDAKLDVNSVSGKNAIKVTYNSDGYGKQAYQEFNLNQINNRLNITNYDGYIIINVNMDSDLEVEEDPNRIKSYKLNSDDDKKIGNVIIQYNTSAQPDLEIHGLNNCNEGLNFYFSTSTEKEFNYDLINDGGKIKSYYDIFAAEPGHSYTNNSRVYRIDVEVSKDGKSLQKITAFKTMAEWGGRKWVLQKENKKDHP